MESYSDMLSFFQGLAEVLLLVLWLVGIVAGWLGRNGGLGLVGQKYYDWLVLWSVGWLV